MHALAYEKGIELGEDHQAVEKSINPQGYNNKMTVPPYIFKAYKTLRNYSQMARYDGFSNLAVFEKEQKANYEDAINNFETLKKYIFSQNIFTEK